MYTYLSSIAKLNNGGKKWLEVDISDIPLSTIFSTYETILVQLTDPFMTDPEILNLESIRLDYQNSAMTFSEFLIDNDDNTLPTYPGTLEITTKTARYADAFRAGYSVTPVSQYGNATSEEPKEDKTWLLLQKDGVDYNYFGKHCLINVNGFFHYSETSNAGVFVKDAMKSRFHCGESTVGILSFNNVSVLKQTPITSDMVFSRDEAPLSSRAIIKLDEDISNKTVLLSIGGYLVFPNTGVFHKVSENSLMVDFDNYSLLDRFFESNKYLDYSDFGLDTPQTNDGQYTLNEIFSDMFITNLLTMSQSFVVILDEPEIYFEEHAVRPSKMPGIYTSYIKPLYPLFLGLGMMGLYWYQKQKPYWSLNVIDGLKHNRLYNTTKTKDQLSVDDTRVAGDPVNWSRARYIKMSVDILSNN